MGSNDHGTEVSRRLLLRLLQNRIRLWDQFLHGWLEFRLADPDRGHAVADQRRPLVIAAEARLDAGVLHYVKEQLVIDRRAVLLQIGWAVRDRHARWHAQSQRSDRRLAFG